MPDHCEVCATFRPSANLNAPRPLISQTFGDRQILLCRGHAGIAKNSQITTLKQLRALYGESNGKRSYIARRAPSAGATQHAPRSAGRRASDLCT
jgi:hypothetical protein